MGNTLTVSQERRLEAYGRSLREELKKNLMGMKVLEKFMVNYIEIHDYEVTEDHSNYKEWLLQLSRDIEADMGCVSTDLGAPCHSCRTAGVRTMVKFLEGLGYEIQKKGEQE